MSGRAGGRLTAGEGAGVADFVLPRGGREGRGGVLPREERMRRALAAWWVGPRSSPRTTSQARRHQAGGGPPGTRGRPPPPPSWSGRHHCLRCEGLLAVRGGESRGACPVTAAAGTTRHLAANDPGS